MTKVLTIGKSTDDGLKELLKFLLENAKVKGVVTLRKTGDDGAISHWLITYCRGSETMRTEGVCGTCETDSRQPGQLPIHKFNLPWGLSTGDGRSRRL